MTTEEPGPKVRTHELHGGLSATPGKALVFPKRPLSEQLTEKELAPVPVHTFAPRTPGWIYVAGALTALAAVVMLTMLVLILRST